MKKIGFLLVCLILCQSLAFAESSFFSEKIEKAKLDVALASIGGESGGGGHWLEMQIAQTALVISERLKENNPHKLNIEDFKQLVSKTKIAVSSDANEFVLNGKLRDAINYFPERLVIKIYQPRWEQFYKEDVDVAGLLYHEFLPYFFGNDLDYIRSKEMNFKKPLLPIFDNMIDGDFASEFISNPKCLFRLKFNKIRKTVTFIWIDNYIVGTYCDEARSGSIVFQCNNNNVLLCYGTQKNQKELMFTMRDPDTGERGWLSRMAEGVDSNSIQSFKRVGQNTKKTSISEFSGRSSYVDMEEEDYSKICGKAFDKAEALALQKCNAYVDSSTQKCQTVDSEIMSTGAPRFVDSCYVEVKVKMLNL